MSQLSDVGVMIMSNCLAALLGFLLGQLVALRRARIRGVPFILPTVVGERSRAFRVAGSVLALLSVITVAQTAVTQNRVQQETRERRAAYQEQLSCNLYLLEQLTARAEDWTEDHQNTTRFVNELNVALKVPVHDERFDALSKATQRYLDQEAKLTEDRAKAPLRTPACP